MVFFKKYLMEEAALRHRAGEAPGMFTVNEFFYSLSGSVPTDRIQLLLVLYDCYRELNRNAESLDDFIFWGDVILSDFEDVDKYFVDPEQLFRNVSEFKRIQDDFSYLTETQREAILSFLGHFDREGAIKTEFLKTWDILLPLYRNFNEKLREKGFTREGMVYRTIAGDDGSVADLLAERFPDSNRFVFVGLNALNGCERRLMRKMQKAGLAEFCWDYCSDWIKDPDNRSSVFLSEFTAEFPSAFTPDEGGLPQTKFSVISVPSSTGQAKVLPQLLSGIGSPGIETAVIIPDESLLLPVLNSIPQDIDRINVTMGFPLKGSALWALMDSIADLQMHIREKDGRKYFHHSQVKAVFSNSILKTVADENTLQEMSRIRMGAGYYIPENAFTGAPLLEMIFRAVPADDIPALEAYQQNIVYKVATMLKENDDMVLELDFAKAYYQAVGRLASFHLPVKTATYFRLLSRLTAGTAVPFKGEPLKGLQIMGPLETRALDFENVIILDCNEGIFPARNVSSSFIPPELRRGFDLPTYEHQDAIWAYYFYRLIHRASTVTMVYDSRTEISRSGEESRYIKQLEMLYGADIRHYVLNAPISVEGAGGDIPKTEEDIRVLRQSFLSASSLQHYLDCPARFYYGTVKGLRPEEEISESLDAGDIGNVLHNVMQRIYEGCPEMTRTRLKTLSADRKGIRKLVSEEICRELRTFEVTGKNIIYEDMVCRYVARILKRDIELLDRYGRDSFRVIGIEKKLTKDICGFHFKGRIDRLDSFADDELRVVDYKTGKVTDDDFLIDEGNAEKVVTSLFSPEEKKKPKIALQMFLYDLFAKDLREARGKRILNSIYQTSRLFVRDVENVELCEGFCRRMEKALGKCLEEMSDVSVPWRRNYDNCEYCDFKNICGR